MAEKTLSPVVASAIKQYEMAASWIARDKLKELSTEQFLHRPAENRNHIYWLMGHLAASSDIAPYLNGTDSIIDKSYIELFDMGQKPKDDASGYPPIAEILGNFEKAIDNSVTALKSLDDDDLIRPPVKPLPEPLQPYFPTRLDIVTGFATHISYHGGQIGTILKMLED